MRGPTARFSEPALLVLVSLLEGPRHGYAIAEDIERLTGTRPGPGTLYGAIGRLVDKGLVTEEAADGRKRPYRLTDSGTDVVSAELAAL
ncbi:MAG: PadR family transcriptional regulator, partial [Propionibacteriales bacterium]|nr:PadR family transcriptional regulator [Propionibacteriales bacterium]